jgi:hypothetical protein
MTEASARIGLARFIIELVTATADVATAGSPA